MTVAVLNPRDCLQENSPRFANNLNRTAGRTQSNRRKRSPRPQSRAVSWGPPPAKSPTKANLVMGQVKILKRGEELASMAPFQAPEKKSPDLGSTERLGPDPQAVPTLIRLGGSKNQVGVASFYAGSAFITSPLPSSLPLPAFFTKKIVTVKNDDATTDLRRILKLNLL